MGCRPPCVPCRGAARDFSMSRLVTAFNRALPSAMRRPKHSLFELCALLPKYGVGARVYRLGWADKGYDPMDHHYKMTSTELVSANHLLARMEASLRHDDCCTPAIRIDLPPPLLFATIVLAGQAKGDWHSDVEGCGGGRRDQSEWRR